MLPFFSKSHVIPKNKIVIPRLELMATEITTKAEFEIEINSVGF